MADEIDRANDRAEHDLQRAIDKARRQQQDVQPCGACLYCGQRVKKGARWCDADCRDDWEAEQ